MAEHALITPRRSPQPADAPTGRRRFGAALLAIGVGGTFTSGIAAGVAASVSDTSAADDADAGLIAICSATEATDDRSRAVWDAAADLLSDDERVDRAYDESQHIYKEYRAGIAQAATIPATTAAGLQAKASLALREMDYADASDLLLVRSVLLQLAGSA